MKVLLALLVAGCAHQSDAEMRLTGPTLEMQLDDGTPTEAPPLPDPPNQQKLRFEPKLGHFIPLRMRFLLAQAGRLVIVFHTTRGSGPGAELGRIERHYDAQLVSDGKDGRWIVEELTLPPQRVPMWITLHGDARLWASSQTRRAPILRLEVAPAPPPGTPTK